MNASAGLGPVRPRTSLRDMVHARIRSAIISGELAPGEVHSAPSLSVQLGVSATPVREAMLDLAREGLVTVMPNKGFKITEVSDSDLDEITQIRQLLEPPILSSVVDLIPDEDFPSLSEAANQIVEAASEGDLPGYLEADRVFHLSLLRYCGNNRLVELVDSLRAQTRLYGLRSLVEQGLLVESAQEHHEILAAIQARDSESFARLLTRHIGHVRGIWAGKAD